MENWEEQLKFIKVKSDGYIYDGNGDVIAKLAEGRTSNFYNAIDAERESAKQEERERIEEHLSFVRSEVLDMPIKTGDKDYLLELLSEIPIHQNNNEQGGK